MVSSRDEIIQSLLSSYMLMSRLLVVDITSVSSKWLKELCSSFCDNFQQEQVSKTSWWPFYFFSIPSQISYYTVHKVSPLPLTNKCSCFTELIWKPPCIIPIAQLCMFRICPPTMFYSCLTRGLGWQLHPGFAQIGVQL